MEAKRATILLVEDDPNDVLLIQRAFERANIANPISVVRGGEDAIAYLEGTGNYADRDAHPFPVVMLLDLKLPRKSGLEVLEWLKSKDILKRLPVVILSSSTESTDVDRAYDLGVNSYLVKPVTFDALIEIVKNAGLYWVIMNEKPDLS